MFLHPQCFSAATKIDGIPTGAYSVQARLWL